MEVRSLYIYNMPYRKQQFVNGENYHIILRAIDNNLLFKDVNDYYRGIFSIYEFNTADPVEILERRKIRAKIKKIIRNTGGPSSPEFSSEIVVSDLRDKLVKILAFCFMPNHIHLLLEQIKNNGITTFMRKVGTGLGGYFNKKYNREGHVFQSRFKDVHIKDEEQQKNAFVYIHTNPISLIEPKWKELGIKNLKKTIDFVEKYKWSSYLDYLGGKNFPSVTDRDSLLGLMGGVEGCRNFVNGWIEYKKELREELNKFSDLPLD